MHRINSCKFNCIKVHKSRKTAVINSIFCYIYIIYKFESFMLALHTVNLTFSCCVYQLRVFSSTVKQEAERSTK